MKLPNYAQAVVPEAKIVKYLLNDAHPTGKDKATFFQRFGFSKSEWESFAQALEQHALENNVASTLTTPEGIHYAVEGNLTTPDGRNPLVRSVWAIDTDSEVPRLITAYPLKRTQEDK
ncbi:MAG: hypothetical protein K8L97_12370 [Anaerolineae bacterium]|nr:hypothetical protein [Anaerolineae bacterium]